MKRKRTSRVKGVVSVLEKLSPDPSCNRRKREKSPKTTVLEQLSTSSDARTQTASNPPFPNLLDPSSSYATVTVFPRLTTTDVCDIYEVPSELEGKDDNGENAESSTDTVDESMKQLNGNWDTRRKEIIDVAVYNSDGRAMKMTLDSEKMDRTQMIDENQRMDEEKFATNLKSYFSTDDSNFDWVKFGYEVGALYNKFPDTKLSFYSKEITDEEKEMKEENHFELNLQENDSQASFEEEEEENDEEKEMKEENHFELNLMHDHELFESHQCYDSMNVSMSPVEYQNQDSHYYTEITHDHDSFQDDIEFAYGHDSIDEIIDEIIDEAGDFFSFEPNNEHEAIDIVATEELEGNDIEITRDHADRARRKRLQEIRNIAKRRWLNVSEIESLLKNDDLILNISTMPPVSPPTSGQLFLFDRSITRNYKQDGHQWVKKKNSNKVREDHVKLRRNNKFCVNGCYIHSSTNATFHKRAYYLLDPNTGKTLYPIVSSKSKRLMDKPPPPSLVLVHYFDTSAATDNVEPMDIDQSMNSTENILNTTSEAALATVDAKGSNDVTMQDGTTPFKTPFQEEEEEEEHIVYHDNTGMDIVTDEDRGSSQPVAALATVDAQGSIGSGDGGAVSVSSGASNASGNGESMTLLSGSSAEARSDVSPSVEYTAVSVLHPMINCNDSTMDCVAPVTTNNATEHIASRETNCKDTDSNLENYEKGNREIVRIPLSYATNPKDYKRVKAYVTEMLDKGLRTTYYYSFIEKYPEFEERYLKNSLSSAISAFKYQYKKKMSQHGRKVVGSDPQNEAPDAQDKNEDENKDATGGQAGSFTHNVGSDSSIGSISMSSGNSTTAAGGSDDIDGGASDVTMQDGSASTTSSSVEVASSTNRRVFVRGDFDTSKWHFNECTSESRLGSTTKCKKCNHFIALNARRLYRLHLDGRRFSSIHHYCFDINDANTTKSFKPVSTTPLVETFVQQCVDSTHFSDEEYSDFVRVLKKGFDCDRYTYKDSQYDWQYKDIPIEICGDSILLKLVQREKQNDISEKDKFICEHCLLGIANRNEDSNKAQCNNNDCKSKYLICNTCISLHGKQSNYRKHCNTSSHRKIIAEITKPDEPYNCSVYEIDMAFKYKIENVMDEIFETDMMKEFLSLGLVFDVGATIQYFSNSQPNSLDVSHVQFKAKGNRPTGFWKNEREYNGVKDYRIIIFRLKNVKFTRSDDYLPRERGERYLYHKMVDANEGIIVSDKNALGCGQENYTREQANESASFDYSLYVIGANLKSPEDTKMRIKMGYVAY